MVIGIDGNEANVSKKVGVQQYAYELLCGMYKLQDNKERKRFFTIFLKEEPKPDLPSPNSFWSYRVIPGKNLWVLKNLTPRLFWREKVDVFFTPSHYLPPFCRSPMVFTLHDLGYLKFSEQFKKYDFWQLKYWTAISIIISKYIIVPSESTRKDIVRHYKFSQKKIKVIPHGYDKLRFRPNISRNLVRQVIKKYRIPSSYILFLSTLKPSKNVEGLLEAYKIFKDRNPSLNVALVIAGKKGWKYSSIFEKVDSLKLKGEVFFTDFVDEVDKPALLSGARAFILPSFWEGFGIDVLEAMACGVPVIASKVASLPEVGGDAVFYINPYNIEGIAEKIEKVLFLPEKERAQMIKKGLRQAEKFSWEKSVKETIKVLELSANR